MCSYARSRLCRRPLHLIVTRVQPQCVHNFLSADIQIILSVRMLLSKGSTFIHDRQNSHVKDLVSACYRLGRQLKQHAFFQSQDRGPPKRFKKLRIGSGWEPPTNDFVDTTTRLLSSSVEHYRPRQLRSNFGSSGSLPGKFDQHLEAASTKAVCASVLGANCANTASGTYPFSVCKLPWAVRGCSSHCR